MLGIALLKRYRLEKIYNIIIVIMSISVMSVIAASMSRGVQLRCGCIGSIFHIPLSYVTLSENVVMILMSVYQTSIIVGFFSLRLLLRTGSTLSSASISSSFFLFKWPNWNWLYYIIYCNRRRCW